MPARAKIIVPAVGRVNHRILATQAGPGRCRGKKPPGWSPGS
jgi:hypothetical protein